MNLLVTVVIVKVDLDNNITDFQISIEEFLHGVVSLTNELVILLNICIQLLYVSVAIKSRC